MGYHAKGGQSKQAPHLSSSGSHEATSCDQVHSLFLTSLTTEIQGLHLPNQFLQLARIGCITLVSVQPEPLPNCYHAAKVPIMVPPTFNVMLYSAPNFRCVVHLYYYRSCSSIES